MINAKVVWTNRSTHEVRVREQGDRPGHEWGDPIGALFERQPDLPFRTGADLQEITPRGGSC
jgi:hypothetical protein